MAHLSEIPARRETNLAQGYGDGGSIVDDYRRFRYGGYSRFSALIQGHETVVRFAAALAMAGVMAFLAQVRIYTPLTPVPFTLQVFGAALMGGLLGRKWGSISASLYLLMGLIGLPVFAGQMSQFNGQFELFGGLVLFGTALSAWYIVGFVAMAWLVGMVVDARREDRSFNLVVLAPAAVGALLVFGVAQVTVLANYDDFYGAGTGFPNPWFLLAAAAVLLIVTGATWLALTTKARRERVELFFGSIVGLLAVYVIGGAGFYFIWASNPELPALTVHSFLAYTVVPFIPVDVAKILVAVGLVTLVRPTSREIEAARPAGQEPV